MEVTATQAKNRFGAMCAHAKTEPVFVEKDGQIDTVIVSAKQFSELQAAHRIEPLSQRKAQFEQSKRDASPAVPAHHRERCNFDVGPVRSCSVGQTPPFICPSHSDVLMVGVIDGLQPVKWAGTPPRQPQYPARPL